MTSASYSTRPPYSSTRLVYSTRPHDSSTQLIHLTDQPDLLSLKNKDWFQIGLVDRPCVETLKRGRCSKSDPHALFKLLTQCLTRQESQCSPYAVFLLSFFCDVASLFIWYQCFYLHRSRKLVSLVCGTFNLKNTKWHDMTSTSHFLALLFPQFKKKKYPTFLPCGVNFLPPPNLYGENG